MNDYRISDKRIDHLKKLLIENPIDHKYDEECELFDGDTPPMQLATRMAFNLLKELNQLPKGIAWIENELKKERGGGDS